MDPETVEIRKLQASLEAFGGVLDFLSGAPPFADFRLGKLAAPIRQQLANGQHLAGISAAGDIVGYLGWISTSRFSAELWLANKGSLPVMSSGGDAVALTIVASRHPEVTTRLLREARRLNPRRRVYFKRGGDEWRIPKKSSVFNILGNLG